MHRVSRSIQDEHHLVARAAACLDRLADEALDGDFCIVTALELLEFFDVFVDHAHQEREERYVFPALLKCGLAKHRVRQLLADHRNERHALGALRENLERAANGDADGREEFVRIARDYSAAQLEHAEEEDRMLVPLTEELLTPEAEAIVLVGFDAVDAELLPKPRKHYIDLVERAGARLGSSVGLPDGTP